MARTDLQINFRIPAALKERLEESARANSRSLTAELVARLNNSHEPSIEHVRTAINEANLRMRYESARMALSLLGFAVTSALEEAPNEIKEMPAFKLLIRTLQMMPSLPDSESIAPPKESANTMTNHDDSSTSAKESTDIEASLDSLSSVVSKLRSNLF